MGGGEPAAKKLKTDFAFGETALEETEGGSNGEEAEKDENTQDEEASIDGGASESVMSIDEMQAALAQAKANERSQEEMRALSESLGLPKDMNLPF